MKSPFHIDKASSDDEYLYVDIPSVAATVQIKLTPEGVTVDIWPSHVAHGSVATCCATTKEIMEAKET